MATLPRLMPTQGDALPASAAPPKQLGIDLWTRYEALHGQRRLFDADYQDIVDLMLPGAPDVQRQRSPGNGRTDRIFDTTATMGLQTLASNMMGAVTNPAIEWFRLTFRDEELSDDQTVSQWLADCTDILLRSYNASNFYQAAYTYYLHYAGFGTAAMFVGSRALQPQGQLFLRFATVPAGSYVIAENADGIVDTLFRIIQRTPRQLVELFGAAAVSRRTMEEASNPQRQDIPRPILHAVYPRQVRAVGSRSNRQMPWASVYLEYDTKTVLDESGFPEFPYVVSRWETLDNTPYGFGPGHLALPDVRTLNTLRELHLQQLVLWVRPPLRALYEGVIGNISLESGAINVLRQADALQTLDLTGRPDLVQIDQQDLRRAIRDAFYVDALSGLPPPDAAQMTAYEVARRIEMMQRLMGPAFTRLLAEMLDPLCDRTFGLHWRAGVLPPIPPPVLQAIQQGKGQLDVEYQGPLARAQRGADVRAIQELVTTTQAIAQASQNTDVWDNLDLDGMVRQVGEVNGTPLQLLKDAMAVMRQRQARQQAQAQQAQAAEVRANLQAAGQAAPLVQALQRQPGQSGPPGTTAPGAPQVPPQAAPGQGGA